MAENSKGRTLKSVERTCSIIDLLLENSTMGVSELADELGLTPGTVHCYLATLLESGYVVKKNNGYQLSMRFLRLGEEVRSYIEGFDIIKDELEAVAAECGERTQFAIEERNKAIYIYQALGDDAVISSFNTGQTEHLHCVSIGKAIIAQYSEERINRIIDEHGLPRKTKNTYTDREKFIEELERVQEQGYAIDDEERVQGVRCIAVPVFDGPEVMGAISITGPARRMRDERLENDLLELLFQAANVIEVNSQLQSNRQG